MKSCKTRVQTCQLDGMRRSCQSFIWTVAILVQCIHKYIAMSFQARSLIPFDIISQPLTSDIAALPPLAQPSTSNHPHVPDPSPSSTGGQNVRLNHASPPWTTILPHASRSMAPPSTCCLRRSFDVSRGSQVVATRCFSHSDADSVAGQGEEYHCGCLRKGR